MSKAKTAGEKATATAEIALETGAAALKTGLEKALKGYDAVLGYGKETAEAVMQVRHRRRQGRRDHQQRNLCLFQAVDRRLRRRHQGHDGFQVGA